MHYSATPPSGGETDHCVVASDDAVNELYVRADRLERKLRQDGWTTITTTAPRTEVILDDIDDAHVQITHEIPTTQTTAVSDALDADGIITTCTAKRRYPGQLFEILLLLNPRTDYSILLPTIIDTEHVATLTTSGPTIPTVYSVITTPTGNRLGGIKHPDPQPSFSPLNAGTTTTEL
jgi:hypothetical protein